MVKVVYMDKRYWEEFYKERGLDKDISDQSTFASFCADKFFQNGKKNILELGSGNGRDAIFFAKNEHNVIAIEQSVDHKNQSKMDANSIKVLSENFVTYDYNSIPSIDIFYSRFTLHAITKSEENILLPKIYNCLQSDGLFCIEVRTINDPLFGKGESKGDNAYFTDHYRRFIDSNSFLKSTLELGFKLLYFTEENNLSIYGDDNPVLMRLVLQK
tara:strand:- start:239 stop:883 length:645 start_codon:yes stop_codon:yes gene_type:complete